MFEFVYKNAKNTNIGNMLFKLNYEKHPHEFFGKDTNFSFHSKIADKFGAKLQELLTFYHENIYHTQKL